MISRAHLPAGYEVVRGHSIELALPSLVAAEYRALLSERLQRALEEQRDKLKSSEPPEAEAKLPEVMPIPDEPNPGWHRVLPNYAETIRSFSEDVVTTRSPDREARERLLAIGRRLTELGPDRQIGRPDGWKSALQNLEAQMPNFRAPIALVRNALKLADVTGQPLRIPPLLLLGPPGVGKTLFSQRLAEMLSVPHATIAFDQPAAGSALRGSDKFWSNSEAGLLFQLVCMGSMGNPIILLDELDKSAIGSDRQGIDPLAQLHGALEPQTARRLRDISVDVEFDASLVTYVATANSIRGLGMPLLSRFEVFEIGPPDRDDAIDVARTLIDQVLHRLKLEGRVSFDTKCAYVLARMSPRLMLRTIERLAAAALQDKRARVTADALWQELDPIDAPRLH